MKQTVVIIGGGLGGLFTGAFLSKEGLRVTILEKNPIIGGGLQCFKRQGCMFETGMHIIGGFQQGGSLYKICSYLDIIDKLEIMHTDKNTMASIFYGEDGRCYTLPSGKDAFTRYLQQEFPNEKDNIGKYMDAMYSISEEVDLFYLRSSDNSIFSHSEEFLMPTDEFIAKYIDDKKLQDLLAYMNPMYGGVAGHTPAYIHAMINVLYIEGSSQFVDGSQQLANCLKAIIEDNGGTIVAGDAVDNIEVEEKKIVKVVTRNKYEYAADWYISDVHPEVLFRIIGDNAFPRHYMQRISSIPNSYSSFGVYVKFKAASQPYINHPRYYQERYGSVWSLGAYNEDDFPQAFMYITPPTHGQGKWASRMIIHCIMPFDAVRKWEDTTIGNRSDEYLSWKEKIKNKILKKMDMLHPGFIDTVEMSFASSPLTIRDYYGSKEGSLYGHQCDCENLMLSQMPIATKVRNLLLTGQNVNLHGICGVPLTAIETAEAIVGKGTILSKINKAV